MASDDLTPRPGAIPKTERESSIIDAQAVSLDESSREAGADTKPATQKPASGPGKRGFIIALAGLGILSSLAYYLWQTDQSHGERYTNIKTSLETMLARIEAVEKSLPSVGSLPGHVAALEKRLIALEQRPAPQSLPPEAIAGVERRIAAIETAGRASANVLANVPTLERRLSAVEAAGGSTRLSDQTAVPVATPQVDLAPLEGSLAALERRLSILEASQNAPKSQIRATETPDARRPQEPDLAALAIVAQSIRRAVERGEGFATELAAAENLGVEAARLAPLKAVARDGAASAQKLAQSFRPLARAFTDGKAAPKSEATGMLDQLTNAATKLVRVSPAGDVKGEDTPGLIAQIDAALQRGSIAQAIATWEKLPEPARKASENWATQAKQRVVAEAAAQLLVSSTFAELGRKRSVP